MISTGFLLLTAQNSNMHIPCLWMQKTRGISHLSASSWYEEHSPYNSATGTTPDLETAKPLAGGS